MDYSGTLRRGWQITWQNKWLIALTLLPAFVTFLITLPYGTIPPTASPEEIAALAGRLILLACLGLILYLLSIVLTLVSHGARIAGVAQIVRGEVTGFRRTLGEGGRALLRLIGLTLLLYVLPFLFLFGGFMLVFVPVTVMSMAGEMGQDDLMAGMGILSIVLLCCLYLFVLLATIFVTFIFPLASRGLVLRHLGVIDAIRHGWRVLRQNLGQVILLALPFVLLYAVLAVFFLPVYFYLLFPSGLDNAVMGSVNGARMAGVMVWLLLYLLATSVLMTWQGTALTLGYLHWTGDELPVPAMRPDKPLDTRLDEPPL